MRHSLQAPLWPTVNTQEIFCVHSRSWDNFLKFWQPMKGVKKLFLCTCTQSWSHTILLFYLHAGTIIDNGMQKWLSLPLTWCAHLMAASQIEIFIHLHHKNCCCESETYDHVLFGDALGAKQKQDKKTQDVTPIHLCES